MKSNLDWALKDAAGVAEHYRTSARESLTSATSSVKGIGASSNMSGETNEIEGMFGGGGNEAASEQYRHFKGWAYVAIKAIAQRVASRPLKLVDLGRPKGTDEIEGRNDTPVWTKNYGDMSTGDVVEQHPLLDALLRPNEVMTQWALMYCTVASLELTGAAYWWFDDSGDGLRIWPLPTNWVTPIHDKELGLNHAYKIRPRGSASEEFIVEGSKIAYFPLPDPSNPMGHISPLQTQAQAVSTDEAIQESQYRAFKNGIFPGVMMTVGRLPDMPGGGPGERPVLEPDQRQTLVDAAKLFYQGATNYNEPLVIDGMIEKIEKFSTSPSEMDFMDSGNIVKARIFQAFGVNPLVLGEITAGSYAQSSMADKHFVSTVVNPILDLMGQVVTSWMLPFFNDSRKLVAYFEPAIADDEDRKQRTWATAIQAGCVTANEVRSTLLHLPPSDDPAADMLMTGGGEEQSMGGGGAAGITDAVDEFLSSAYAEDDIE